MELQARKNRSSGFVIHGPIVSRALRLSEAVLLLILIAALSAPGAFAQGAHMPYCPSNFDLLTSLDSSIPFPFRASRAADGTVTVNWKSFKELILAGLAKKYPGRADLNPSSIRVYVDNRLKKELPIEKGSVRFRLDPSEQYSIRLEAVTAKGEVIERTEHALLEKTKIRSVNPKTYAGERPFKAISPLDKKLGIDSEMPEIVQKIGRKKVVFVWKNPQDSKVKSLKGDVDFRVLRDKNGKIKGYTATDQSRSAKGLPPVRFAADEAVVKVDAAYNENSFLWDDMFTCLHVSTFDPELCRQTVEFWLNVQKHHSQGLGDIPREVLKSNGTSFNPYETVHLGKTSSNGSYSNPNIMGDVVENLVDQTGLTKENRDLMKRTLESMNQYGKWMDEHRAVKDSNGRFMGYWISDLGSGMDNIGRAPNNDFKSTGFVDELARRIELEKSSARIHARLGEFKEAELKELKAKELERLLNGKYWSEEKGFYYDLVPGSGGKMVRQEDMPTVAGFWPLFSRSANPEQMERITRDWYTPETFGGDFPVRSLPPIMQKLRPGSYHPEGGYWRGGNWAPTDIMKALGEERSGRPDLAAQTMNKKLIADTEVSQRHVAGGGHKTVFETLGTDEQGRVIPGIQVEPDGRVHKTRSDFVGWSGTPHTFGKLRNSLGIRPVSAFGGKPQQLEQWIKVSTESPAFQNSSHFKLNPKKHEAAQKALYAEGYLEINLPFDPGSDAVQVAGFPYQGRPVNLKVEKAGVRNGKQVMRVTVTSDSPINMNLAFNQLFGARGEALRSPAATSPIVKARSAKAGTTVVEFELEKVP